MAARKPKIETKSRSGANGVKKVSPMKLQCPLADHCRRCANAHFPSIQRVNEHIKRTHLNTRDPDVYLVSESQYENVSRVTKQHHLKSPREKLSYIRKALLLVEPQDAAPAFFKPTCDQLKAAAKVIGSCHGPENLDAGAFKLARKITSLATSVPKPAASEDPNVWWFKKPKHEQWEHLRLACQIFPLFVNAMQIEGYTPPPPPPVPDAAAQPSEEQPWPALVCHATDMASHGNFAATPTFQSPVPVSATETPFHDVQSSFTYTRSPTTDWKDVPSELDDLSFGYDTIYSSLNGVDPMEILLGQDP